jgi:hypothetical protein
MRIDYLLPAMDAGIPPDSPGTEEPGLSFRDQLHRPTVDVPVSWEHELHLHDRPFTAAYMAPPPRPKSLQMEAVEVERVRWRNMLSRHSGMGENSAKLVTSTSQRSVEVMLEMLREMQEIEDGMMAESVSLTRG